MSPLLKNEPKSDPILRRHRPWLLVRGTLSKFYSIWLCHSRASATNVLLVGHAIVVAMVYDMISLLYKMYRIASQLILARSNLRLGFRSILLFTITITVDTSAQVTP